MSKNQFPLDENRREYEAWFNYYANKYDQERQSHLTPSVARAKAGQVFNLAGLNGPENAQDTIIGHLTPGEIVIPLNYQTAELKRYLTNLMGHDLLKYTVGSGEEKLNPESGLPAFWSARTSFKLIPHIWTDWIRLKHAYTTFPDRNGIYNAQFSLAAGSVGSFDFEVKAAGRTVRSIGPSTLPFEVPAGSTGQFFVRARSHGGSIDINVDITY